MKAEIKIPAVGESITEATIVEWNQSDGSQVQQGDLLLTLETDKANVEVVAEASGVLSISSQAGDTVAIGSVVGTIDSDAVSEQPQKESQASSTTSDSSGSPKPTGANPIDIVVPGVGESVTEATLVEWMAEDGSFVQKDEEIVTLETEKASVELVAEVSGILKTKVAAGETVQVGTVLGSVTPAEGKSTTSSSTSPSSTSPSQGPTNTTLSPAAQRVVGENKLDASQISGTGKHGQITKADALNAAAASKSAAPSQPAATQPASKSPAPTLPQALGGEAPEEKRLPMSRLRQTIARRLVEAQHTAAILTTFNEIDMTEVMALRKKYKDSFQKKHDVKLGFMGFFMKATIEALKEFPLVNASIDGNEILSRNYVNMGIAVGTEKGLLVPVIKNADKLSLADLEKSLVFYAGKARDGKIGIDDLSGGTFTISNGGTYGSLLSTPILNPPQSGILGLHKIEERPIALNGQVVIRPMMYVALSYDHRIIDGSESVRFLVKIKEAMEDPARMLLEV
ncbi:MAG: 2-oxoglutarate dehydrogenase complex dihydrolipoyllysine-residue succinyltransferase [Bdellovibrionales bacterium]|nr:2-oxoglutarate dehydrogenase complex dihydrolipoyllysine-residue succinyltransferase [Bdellovibrionales bacterium]